MSHRIELPPELQSLIEKRELADRRQPGTPPADETSAAMPPDLEDRRQGERRAGEQPDEQPNA
jgi:hypothetical protein